MARTSEWQDGMVGRPAGGQAERWATAHLSMVVLAELKDAQFGARSEFLVSSVFF
jgi:hypothetical protein